MNGEPVGASGSGQGTNGIRRVHRIAIEASWTRCRDLYGLSHRGRRSQRAAPPDGPLLRRIIPAAQSLAAEFACPDGVVAVADGEGRVAAVFGDDTALAVAREHELAAGYDWSEPHRGTNEIGTALVDGSAVVAGREHWLDELAGSAGAGFAVSDPDCPAPCAVLAWCVHRPACPGDATDRLRSCAWALCSRLRAEGTDETALLLAQYHEARSRARGPVAVLDRTGLLLAGHIPGGGEDRLPEATGTALVRLAEGAADGHAHAVAVVPVRHGDDVVGVLLTTSADARGTGLDQAPVPRIAGAHGGHVLLVSPAEIRLARAEDKTVWLYTDRGLLRALDHTLDRVAARLAPHGFLRVHRGCVVNLHRVREIAPTFRGAVVLVLDGPDRETVPVSRRRAGCVRRALGM